MRHTYGSKKKTNNLMLRTTKKMQVLKTVIGVYSK
jgi:hypothetical protein